LEIEAVMNVARSWNDLCEVMDHIETHPPRNGRRVFRAVFRDLTMILTEFMSQDDVGFVVSFQDANGEQCGVADTSPKRLEDAKVIAYRRAVEYVGGTYVDAETIIKGVRGSWVETVSTPASLSAGFTV
jgi:hypothetical protein